MTQTNSKQPADTLRYGLLKGTIWSNQGKDGKPPMYSVVYSRGYTTADGQWKDTNSLGEIDNLKLGVLYAKIADRITELKAADRKSTDADDNVGEGEQ
ncbi:hypothetical protein FF011L_12280 [Roseimaritima multifibrata]|uniref:Uncharacterized protein n=1 Tax=Roseimaritima multifibrata TaxID=1930274 RepID=A0A517MC91_9BACT|nr:hypothetical protein [Roseimaritima multifibrata]QDS92485.1 hypothetical protein FF011L_12280 [Roseimaritima multifibrata]